MIFKLKKLFLLVIFAVCGSLAQAESFSFAYIGTTNSGQGFGSFGHTFIVFARHAGFWSNAKVLQYTLNFDEVNQAIEEMALIVSTELPLSHGTAIMSRFRLHLYMDNADSFISKYRNEGRTINLYRLNIDEEVVNSLYNHLMNDEIQERANGEAVLYNFVKKNCANFLLYRINQIFTKYDLPDFPIIWDERSFVIHRYFSRNRLSSNFPILLPALFTRHPLINVDERVVFVPSEIVISLTFSEWQKLYRETMIDLCEKNDILIETQISLFTQRELRCNRNLQRNLLATINSCRSVLQGSDRYRLIHLETFIRRLLVGDCA